MLASRRAVAQTDQSTSSTLVAGISPLRGAQHGARSGGTRAGHVTDRAPYSASAAATLAPVEEHAVALEDLPSLDAPLRCEVRPYPHEQFPKLPLPPCSHEVTHYGSFGCLQGTNRGSEGLTCSAIVAFIRSYMDTGQPCPRCKRPTAECWSLRPV